MMFEAVVILYVGLEVETRFKDDLGPYKTREHCEIRTAQMMREEVWPLIETMSPAPVKRTREICLKVR